MVTGFEPLDILEGIRRAVLQLETGRHEVENAYPRAVLAEGNPRAQAMLDEVFEVTDRAWRGIGVIPRSGWRLADAYRDFDAERRFAVGDIHTAESTICRSGEVLQGLIKPHECAAFGQECTPRTPLGATMVSSEGACAAYYLTGGWRDAGGRPVGDLRRPGPGRPREGWGARCRCGTPRPIVMGHGGGGALGRAGRAPVPARVRGRGRRSWATPRSSILDGSAGVLHRLLRGPAAVLPGRLDRRPRGERHRQRPGDVRRGAAVPVAGVHPGGGHRTGRPRPRGDSDGGRRQGRRGCGWSPATPRWSTRATATAST